MGRGPSEYGRARFPIQTKTPDVLEAERLQEASRPVTDAVLKASGRLETPWR